MGLLLCQYVTFGISKQFENHSESISAKEGHLNSRSDCVNLFVEFFGRNPLQKSEFRANPILFKVEEFADLAVYPDIGNL